MQNAREWQYRSQSLGRVLAFPAHAAAEKRRSIDVHAQFERVLIFVLCSLWAVGMVMWTLVSVVGLGHGAASTSLVEQALTVPTSLPTLQSATLFAIRLMLGS